METINLLPWRVERQEKLKKLLLIEIIVAALLTVVLLVLMHYYFAANAKAVLAQNKILSQEIRRLTTENAQLKELEKSIAEIKKKIIFIHSLQFYRFVSVKLFNAITPIVPKNINFTSVKMQGQHVTLEGHASSNMAITDLVNNIESDQLFTSPKIDDVTSSTYNKIPVTKFSITFNVRSHYKPIELEKH